ncbi:hypothetical protein BH11ARM1_BH11ARM1_11300 [soil metagenome]
MSKSAPKKTATRMARTIRSLSIMAGLGITLTAYSIYSNGRDVRLATGPKGDAQHEFFLNAAERPDMELFFRSLTPKQRVEMSANIGHYDDPLMPKLIGKCLGTFDVDARAALTNSMAELAKTQPKAVAEQLALKGSFQQLAVATALKAAGTDSLNLVTAQLSVADARPNAVAYLVSVGPPSVPSLLPVLNDKDKDVRLAGADALGKLRATTAIPKLTDLYTSTKGDEHFGYLAALAGIGSKSSEPLLAQALNDPSIPVAERAQAEIGLGRIATASAVALLWKYPTSEEPTLREGAISALQVAGDSSFAAGTSEETKLRIAEGVHSETADSVIKKGLQTPSLRLAAAKVAGNRSQLVPDLVAALDQVNPDQDGDLADQLIRALFTTPEGTRTAESLKQPEMKGLVERRLQLSAPKV